MTISIDRLSDHVTLRYATFLSGLLATLVELRLDVVESPLQVLTLFVLKLLF